MFSAQKSLIAAALLSIVSLGTTVIDPQSAEAAIVVQTSATMTTMIATNDVPIMVDIAANTVGTIEMDITTMVARGKFTVTAVAILV
jgi:hypothetical protein